MKYLAIRDKEYGGVYSCETKKEQSNLMRKFQGYSMKTFEEDEKASAYSWAGVSMTKPLSHSRGNKCCDFENLINTYAQMGYNKVTIFLVGNRHYGMYINQWRAYTPATFKQFGDIVMISECFADVNTVHNCSVNIQNIIEIRPEKITV